MTASVKRTTDYIYKGRYCNCCGCKEFGVEKYTEAGFSAIVKENKRSGINDETTQKKKNKNKS
jgi:hypothetical protein